MRKACLIKDRFPLPLGDADFDGDVDLDDYSIWNECKGTEPEDWGDWNSERVYDPDFDNDMDVDNDDYLIWEEWAEKVILRPNFGGEYADWPTQHPRWGCHWEKVDEATADGSFIETSSEDIDYYKDLYDVRDLNLPQGYTITSVTVYIVVKAKYEDTFPGVLTLIRGRDAFGQWQLDMGEYHAVPGDAWITYSKFYENNTFTGQPWEQDDINDLQIGIRGCSNWRTRPGMPPLYYPVRCTQVYAIVAYE